MVWDIPVLLRGSKEVLRVEYGENTGVAQSGFDALELPFPPERCLGYPMVYAYFPNMGLTGYKRYCGFIQLIQRTEERGSREQQRLNLDVGEEFRAMGNPYFSYGYPASLFDAPCCNLGDCDRLVWRAFTYLVDPPSRMNGDKMGFLAGFSWGYTENREGCAGLLDFKLLTPEDFARHRKWVADQCPNLTV